LRTRLLLLAAFIAVSTATIAQNISVPGVSSGGSMNTDKMIEELMDAEREPLNRMESNVEEYEKKLQEWNEIEERLETLRDSARGLYSFENPFDARSASSSNEAVLTASAERRAPETTSRITVEQIAKADTFLSGSISRDREIAAGTYGFRVGEQDVTFTFDGGDLTDFVQTVNREAADLVEARVVNDTADTSVIVFESQMPGAENKLQFLESARQLATEVGVIEPARDVSRNPELTSEVVRIQGQNDLVRFNDEGMTVRAGGRAVVPLDGRLSTNPNMVLELEARIINREDEARTPPPEPPGPSVPEGGGVTLGDVTVQNAPSDLVLPEREQPEQPEIIRSNRFLLARSGGRSVPLENLSLGDSFETVQLPIGEAIDELDSVVVQNDNTFRDIVVRNLRVFDPTARGDAKPLRPAATASDAKLRIDGVQVTRSSNTIDDLIEGTTINLQSASPEPVTLSVGPDKENTKNAIIEFVGNYNQVIRDINILTRTNEQIIQEIGYFDEEQREQAREELGLFQGELALNQLRSRLQRVMMNSYPTGPRGNINLLAQLGISTNATGFNTSGVDASRLRGYLEIDEEQLDSVLDSDFRQVKRLFGDDSDGDLRVDTGIAYEIENNVRPYVEVGGIIAARKNTLDTQISSTEEDMREKEDDLQDYRQELERDFGEMQGAMQRLEEQTQQLQRLNSGGGGR
jgi:flagellar hook-associated protein 2